jgi:hypothetical protein
MMLEDHGIVVGGIRQVSILDVEGVLFLVHDITALFIAFFT